MHLFHWNILLYLLLHALGGFFCMAGILGIPGQLDEEKGKTKVLSKWYGFLMIAAFYGFTPFFLISVVAFYFHFLWVGKLFAIINLFLGMGLVSMLMAIYRQQTK